MKKCTWLFESALFGIVSIGCLSVCINVDGSCCCYSSFVLCFSSFRTQRRSFSFFSAAAIVTANVILPLCFIRANGPLTQSQLLWILHRYHASPLVVVRPVSCLKNTSSRYFPPPKTKKNNVNNALCS